MNTVGARDAVVEDVTNLSPAEAEQGSSLPPVVATSVAQQREGVRTRVTYIFAGATIAAGGTAAGCFIAGLAGAAQVASAVFAPLLGITGTIIGFYFGGKDPTA
jgi:hypothetical protein